MPDRPKGTLYMSNAERKRLADRNAREQAAAEQEEQDRQLAEAEAQAGKQVDEDTPLVIDLKSGRGGGHHCRYKDSATTHPVTQRCFKLRHMGGCRNCARSVSFKYGCDKCGAKGEELQFTNIVLQR